MQFSNIVKFGNSINVRITCTFQGQTIQWAKEKGQNVDIKGVIRGWKSKTMNDQQNTI
jgi:hypothetical protein